MANSDVPPKSERTLPLVIVVDDDEAVLRSLRTALQGKYILRTCDKPAGGVVDVRTYDPELVLLDIRMPEHDGFWVFSEIRKFNSRVPIIFNSAYQDKVDRRDVEGMYQPFAYLPKSGCLRDILQTLAHAIASINWQPA